MHNLKDNIFWLDVSAANIFDYEPSSGDNISSILEVNPNLENQYSVNSKFSCQISLNLLLIALMVFLL